MKRSLLLIIILSFIFTKCSSQQQHSNDGWQILKFIPTIIPKNPLIIQDPPPEFVKEFKIKSVKILQIAINNNDTIPYHQFDVLYEFDKAAILLKKLILIRMAVLKVLQLIVINFKMIGVLEKFLMIIQIPQMRDSFL